MLSGIFQAGAKALGGGRFSVVSLMPAALLIIVVATLIASGAYTKPQPSLGLVFDKFSKNPGLAIVAVFGIFIVAVLLRPFQVAFVQLLEGYWWRWQLLDFAKEVATERHRRLENTAEMMTLAEDPDAPTSGEFGQVADYARRLRALRRMRDRAQMVVDRYPLAFEDGSDPDHVEYDDRLMPTLLGNILRDGEDNAGRRYGLFMPVVYPRLYPSLSPKLDKAIGAQLDMIDTTSAFCVIFAIIGLAGLPLIGRMDWWSFVAPSAFLMSAFAYQGALASAREHGRLLATALDLHRFDMLQALHYRLPLTAKEELDFNRSLSNFLDSRDTDAAVERMGNFRYVHPAAAVDGTAKPPDTTEADGGQPPDW